MKNKGIALPIVIIFISLFLSVPFFYYYYSLKQNQANESSVRGTFSEVPEKNGVTVRVSSSGGSWDLYQYLCDDRDACLKSLSIGKSWGIVSGGITDLHEFNISADQNWDPKFKYLKIYTSSSWGSMLRVFDAYALNQADSIELSQVFLDGTTYNVILVPLNNITTDSRILVEFRDF